MDKVSLPVTGLFPPTEKPVQHVSGIRHQAAPGFE